MNCPFPREVLEDIKTKILVEAYEMREVNKNIPVSGKRIKIATDDWDIDVVYYKADIKSAPLIIAFHGGGYLFGGNALNDALWKNVRDELKADVASIEYRKSPEYQYKAALDDAYDATVYFREHAIEYDINPDKISVMGASAGAGLAATLCLYAKQRNNMFFEKQILLYPFLDVATDPESKGPGSLSGPVMYIFNELHCNKEDAKLPLVSPVYANQDMLEALPPAIICYADNDNLKWEGMKYANMLREAGVEVEDMMAKEMPHGFMECGFGELSEADWKFLSEETLDKIKSGSIPRVAKEVLAFVNKNMKH